MIFSADCAVHISEAGGAGNVRVGMAGDKGAESRQMFAEFDRAGVIPNSGERAILDRYSTRN
jgi:hypothetical protein